MGKLLSLITPLITSFMSNNPNTSISGKGGISHGVPAPPPATLPATPPAPPALPPVTSACPIIGSDPCSRDKCKIWHFLEGVYENVQQNKHYIRDEIDQDTTVVCESGRVKNLIITPHGFGWTKTDGADIFGGPLNWDQLPDALEYLYIHNTQITGPIQFDLLPDSLIWVDLMNNHFDQIVNLSQKKRNLGTVRLPGNKLSGTLKLDQDVPTSLEKFDVRNNPQLSVIKSDPNFVQPQQWYN